LFARASLRVGRAKHFCHEMFYYRNQEDRAGWSQGVVYRIPRTFRLRQRQMSVSLPMGQGQNVATGALRTAARPRTATSLASVARRFVRSRCYVQSQKTSVALNSSCPEPVVQQGTEISVPLPRIELPDSEGFYAGLVLRKIRAASRPGWEFRESEGSSPSLNTVDRSAVAQTPSEVARHRTSGDPIETLLVEMARRHVQTSLFEERSS
jgi:hypothetical protein